jgi:hypothetical protein
VEKQRYEVISKIDNIEIRMYPEMILAMVRGYEDRDAFGILFNYISGYNTLQEKIAMKTPVINSHKIEMTAPVVSNKDFFSFIMPSVYNKNALPIPIDNRILIKVEPEKKVAVIKANGYLSTKKIKKFHHLLFEQLRNNAIEVKGSLVIMRYNSPFTPPFMRKNEIGIVISL